MACDGNNAPAAQPPPLRPPWDDWEGLLGVVVLLIQLAPASTTYHQARAFDSRDRPEERVGRRVRQPRPPHIDRRGPTEPEVGAGSSKRLSPADVTVICGDDVV